MSVHFHKPAHAGELFSKLVKEVSHISDALVGHGMTEQERLEREIAENEGWRRALYGR